MFVDVLNDVKLEHLQDVRLQNMVVAAFQLYASVLKDSDTAKDIFKNEFGALPEPSFFKCFGTHFKMCFYILLGLEATARFLGDFASKEVVKAALFVTKVFTLRYVRAIL